MVCTARGLVFFRPLLLLSCFCHRFVVVQRRQPAFRIVDCCAARVRSRCAWLSFSPSSPSSSVSYSSFSSSSILFLDQFRRCAARGPSPSHRGPSRPHFRTLPFVAASPRRGEAPHRPRCILRVAALAWPPLIRPP